MNFNSDKEYYADRNYLTNSSLKLLHSSPMQFYLWLTNQQPNTSSPALEIGKAFHALVLEGVVNFVGYDGVRRGKEYMAFKEENDGLIVLSKKEESLIYAMQDALAKCPEAQALLANEDDFSLAEHPAVSEWDGIKIKGKADLYVERDFSKKFLVDVKTTGGTLEEFRRNARYMHYDQQAAIYCKLFNAEAFYFIAVTKSWPHEVGVYECSQEFLNSGMRKADKAIERYKTLFLDNQFNPYAAEVGIL